MNRECFLDRLRVAATCAVVLLHTVTGIMDTADMTQYPLQKTVFLVVLDLITWCVPLFVMISGYLFLDPQKEISFPKMITKYCRRIVFALFLFGVPYACMELMLAERAFRIGMIGEAFWMVCKGQTWSHMWYLYMILILYLFTPLLKWSLQRIHKSCLYGGMLFLLLGSSILPFVKKLFEWESLVVLPDGGIYLFYYLCGYLFVCARGTNKEQSDLRKLQVQVGKHIKQEKSSLEQGKWEEGKQEKSSLEQAKQKQGRLEQNCKNKIENIKEKVVIVSLVCLFGGMVCSRLVGNYSVQMAYNYPFTVAASILMVWIAWRNEEKMQQNNTTLWKSAGGLCFTIYLIHPVFVNLFYKFFHITPLKFSIWFSLPGIFIVVLLLSIAVAWVLRRIRVLRKYVL